MKKIFSMLLVCCTAFVFADDIRDETDENTNGYFRFFDVEGPVLEEDEEPMFRYCVEGEECECDESESPQDSSDADAEENEEQKEQEEQDSEEKEPCPAEEIQLEEDDIIQEQDDQEETIEISEETAENNTPSTNEDIAEELINQVTMAHCLFNKEKENRQFRHKRVSYIDWPRFKMNFGMEKVRARFPQRPAVSQSQSLFCAYAYDHAILYSVTGFFPPLGNIDPMLWFADTRYALSAHPYTLLGYKTYQNHRGDWIMDYTVLDNLQNLIIKARGVVTPFNAYTIQCVKPNGARDYFDYFVDNFMIQCNCDE